LVRNLETKLVPLKMPPSIITSADRPGLEEWASALYEWFSLIRLMSPRVEAQDSIDPFLSRYDAPTMDADGEAGTMRLCKMSWQGLLSADWLHELLAEVMVACPTQAWVFMSATAFSRTVTGSSTEIAFLRPPEAGREYLLWEIGSPE
jgi:ribonuclease P/MRP protein subunit RPP40